MSESYECPTCGRPSPTLRGLRIHQSQSHDGEKRDEMLHELRRLDDEFENSPSTRMMSEHGDFSFRAYYDRFGSWNDALEEAGISINKTPSVQKEDLINSIKELGTELGRAPSFSEMSEQGEYSPHSCITHFGSWICAVDEAGFEPLLTGKGENHGQWVEEPKQIYYGPDWRSARRETLERDGWKCQHPGCGMLNEEHIEEYGKSLDVHHIDGDHTNHNIDNLITLCKSHHLSTWQPLSPLRPQVASD